MVVACTQNESQTLPGPQGSQPSWSVAKGRRTQRATSLQSVVGKPKKLDSAEQMHLQAEGEGE